MVVGEAARVHEGPAFAGGLDGAVVAEEPAAAALQARHSSTTLVSLGLLAFKSHIIKRGCFLYNRAGVKRAVAMVTCRFSNDTFSQRTTLAVTAESTGVIISRGQ